MTFLGKTLPRLTKLNLKKVLQGKNYHDSFNLAEIPPPKTTKVVGNNSGGYVLLSCLYSVLAGSTLWIKTRY